MFRRLDQRFRMGDLSADGEAEARDEPIEDRQRDVLVDRHYDRDALAAPIFRDERKAGGDRLARRSRRDRFARQPDFSALRVAEAEQGLEQLGAPCPDQSR